MTASLVFRAGERDRISACHDAIAAATEACGLAMPSRGEVHAQLHRWLIRRVRRGARHRPRHAEMAALLLAWSREQGNVDLFALCPYALAILRIHGEQGLLAVGSLHAGLRGAGPLLDALPGSTPRSAARTAATAPGERRQASA